VLLEAYTLKSGNIWPFVFLVTACTIAAKLRGLGVIVAPNHVIIFAPTAPDASFGVAGYETALGGQGARL
jgi:hypothetical protein